MHCAKQEKWFGGKMAPNLSEKIAVRAANDELAEKFVGSLPFRLATLMCLATAVFAIGGSIYLNGYSANLLEQLKISAKEAKAEIEKSKAEVDKSADTAKSNTSTIEKDLYERLDKMRDRIESGARYAEEQQRNLGDRITAGREKIETSTQKFESMKDEMEKRAIRIIVQDVSDKLLSRNSDIAVRIRTAEEEATKARQTLNRIAAPLSELQNVVEGNKDLRQRVALIGENQTKAIQASSEAEKYRDGAKAAKDLVDNTLGQLQKDLPELRSKLDAIRNEVDSAKTTIDQLKYDSGLVAKIEDLQKQIDDLRKPVTQPASPQPQASCVRSVKAVGCDLIQAALFRKYHKPEDPKKPGSAWDDGIGGDATNGAIMLFQREIGASATGELLSDQTRRLLSATP
jgi:chromosome segregation ATPase